MNMHATDELFTEKKHINQTGWYPDHMWQKNALMGWISVVSTHKLAKKSVATSSLSQFIYCFS